MNEGISESVGDPEQFISVKLKATQQGIIGNKFKLVDFIKKRSLNTIEMSLGFILQDGEVSGVFEEEKYGQDLYFWKLTWQIGDEFKEREDRSNQGAFPGTQAKGHERLHQGCGNERET